jgi:C-terminal processing protease CtpA/Prc
LFVLVSPTTFSAAEGFAYNLQCLKRATIIGEPTRGGAHPGEFRWLSPHFSLFVPQGRGTNPITQSNWEGVGVQPDVPVAHADALRIAQVLALEQLGTAQDNPQRQTEIADRLRVLGDKAFLTP